MSAIEGNLARLGIVLPAAPKPVAAYVAYVRTGNLVFISGQLPGKDGKMVYTGQATAARAQEAADAARLAGINAIAVLKEACGGDLERVERIVRLGVFVASADDFFGQPAAANGASELMAAVFGEAGRHARAAVGTNVLPLNALVEVEMVAQIR